MTFSLAGLLRVRGVQERAAAEDLSRARAERARAVAAHEHARSSLAGLSTAIDDGHTLMAMAAARAAGRSALSDLQALSEMARAEEARAKDAHIEARRELKGLERLEATHRADADAAARQVEQAALDEIAIVRASRDRAGNVA